MRFSGEGSNMRLNAWVRALAPLAMLAMPLAAQAQSFLEGSFDPAIPTLVDTVGHYPGEAITSPDQTDAYLRALAAAAGFEYVGSSEINANPRDTADYPDGVWTLPPSLRLGDTDRDRYMAIGESDRMTLKFRKPA